MVYMNEKEVGSFSLEHSLCHLGKRSHILLWNSRHGKVSLISSYLLLLGFSIMRKNSTFYFSGDIHSKEEIISHQQRPGCNHKGRIMHFHMREEDESPACMQPFYTHMGIFFICEYWDCPCWISPTTSKPTTW